MDTGQISLFDFSPGRSRAENTSVPGAGESVKAGSNPALGYLSNSTPPNGGGRSSWSDFVAKNPLVLMIFIRWTDEARAAGSTRASTKRWFERLRADLSITVTGGNGWRLDNSWTGDAARMIAELRPDLAGMFEMRKQRGA
jgi:hypothetical protein